MDAETITQILDELIPTFQLLDTQTTALLQFLKDKGYASDEQLAPYFRQADDGSSVRWLAVRVRLERLLGVPEDTGGPRTDAQEGGSANTNETVRRNASDEAAERTYEGEVADNFEEIERKDERNGKNKVA